MNHTVSFSVAGIIRTVLSMLLLISITACQQERPEVELPAWINDPQNGAVGSAVTHVRGRHAQEELAITRARERLASRYGVEVSSVQAITEKVINDRAYVTSDKRIDQTMKRTEIKAHVRETFYDATRDVVWVWVYPVE